LAIACSPRALSGRVLAAWGPHANCGEATAQWAWEMASSSSALSTSRPSIWALREELKTGLRRWVLVGGLGWTRSTQPGLPSGLKAACTDFEAGCAARLGVGVGGEGAAGSLLSRGDIQFTEINAAMVTTSAPNRRVIQPQTPARLRRRR